LGRRWNVDPAIKEWESPYATFANNPVLFTDLSGLDATNEPATSENSGWTEKKKINVHVSLPAGDRDFVLEAGYQKAKDQEAFRQMTGDNDFVVLTPGSAKELGTMLEKLKKDTGADIGNLYIESHGPYKKNSFKIGKDRISNAKNKMKLLSDYIAPQLSSSSSVVITACNVGGGANIDNPDESQNSFNYMQRLANAFNTDVYASRSYVPTSNYDGDPLENTEYYSYSDAKVKWDKGETNAIQHLGEWVKSTPWSPGENTWKCTIVYHLRLNPDGGFGYSKTMNVWKNIQRDGVVKLLESTTIK
jgi:hypothetical protein